MKTLQKLVKFQPLDRKNQDFQPMLAFIFKIFMAKINHSHK
jgi:hypothetical protein